MCVFGFTLYPFSWLKMFMECAAPIRAVKKKSVLRIVFVAALKRGRVAFVPYWQFEMFL